MTEFDRLATLAKRFRHVMPYEKLVDLGIKELPKPVSDGILGEGSEFHSFSIYKHEQGELVFAIASEREGEENTVIFAFDFFYPIDDDAKWLVTDTKLSEATVKAFAEELESQAEKGNSVARNFCKKMLNEINKADTLPFREIQSSLQNFKSACDDRNTLSKIERMEKRLAKLESEFLGISTGCMLTDEDDILGCLEQKTKTRKR